MRHGLYPAAGACSRHGSRVPRVPLALLAGLSLSWAMMQKSLPDFTEAVPVEIVEIARIGRSGTETAHV